VTGLVQIPASAHVSPAWLARPVHSPERRHFSVLCWRGWCDHEFKRRAVAYTVTGITGAPFRLADLPVRTCPIPAECECECHDQVAPKAGG
jgi:hypothetical protein